MIVYLVDLSPYTDKNDQNRILIGTLCVCMAVMIIFHARNRSHVPYCSIETQSISFRYDLWLEMKEGTYMQCALSKINCHHKAQLRPLSFFFLSLIRTWFIFIMYTDSACVFKPCLPNGFFLTFNNSTNVCCVCVSVFNFNVLSSHIDTNFLFVQAIMFVCDLAIRS